MWTPRPGATAPGIQTPELTPAVTRTSNILPPSWTSTGHAYGASASGTHSPPTQPDPILQALLQNILVGRDVRRRSRAAWSWYESGVNDFENEFPYDRFSEAEKAQIRDLKVRRSLFANTIPEQTQVEDEFEILSAQILSRDHPIVATFQIVRSSRGIFRRGRLAALETARRKLESLDEDLDDLRQQVDQFRNSDANAADNHLYKQLLFEKELCEIDLERQEAEVSRLFADVSEPLDRENDTYGD